MRLGRTSFVKLITHFRNQEFIKNVLRYASTGANSFSEEADHLDLLKIESYWRDKIKVDHYDDSNITKKKFYVLAMFPYPSGKLHMGHVRVYTISDSVAHYYRLKGYNVLHPMGWDAFGLPAENAAIERQLDPAEWTKTNIKEMKNQFQMLNYCFDWDRELSTCQPEYYRWTQKLFLKLYEKGLVYQRDSYVNWDPIDQTVLAEEQVSKDNTSWRSGATVEKKLLKQWYIKTSAFSKNLLDCLNNPQLKNWKDIMKIQSHWIGPCNGTTMILELVSNIPGYPKTIDLWMEWPEFVEYAKFVVISPDSLMNKPDYCSEVTPNIQMLDAKVINPFNGEELPIYVTDIVNFPEFRENYLGIPAINMDDYQFLETVGLTFTRHSIKSEEQRLAKREEILEKAKEWGIGGYPTSTRTKDWLVSRQRFWGTPIPLIRCKECGVQPVPDDQLPVLLPKIRSNSSTKPPGLNSVTDWVNTACPKCGRDATRETDTLDTFVDSSWYFLRFVDPKNENNIYSFDAVKRAYPVDLYIGGKEHGTLHLYYARFMAHFLHSQGLLQSPEPFVQLLTQGVVKGRAYKVAKTEQYIKPEEVIEINGKYIKKHTEEEVVVEWKKMSKSKHNGVDPLDLLKTYGIDTIRLLILAEIGPSTDRNWSLSPLQGIQNWQCRLWKMVKKFIDLREKTTIEQLRHQPTDKDYVTLEDYMFDSRNFFLKSINFSITESQNFNVAISRLQGMTNSLYKASDECIQKGINFERSLAAHIIMLAPVAPHFSSELWSGYCSAKHHLISEMEVDLSKEVLQQKWPEIDMHYPMRLKIFVNNRQYDVLKITRGKLESLTIDDALTLLQANPKFTKKVDLQSAKLSLDIQNERDGKLYVQCEMKKAKAEKV